MSKNIFFKGVFLGALVGGAVTLLHKETRKEVTDVSKKTVQKIKHVVCHPIETVEQIQSQVNEFINSIEEITDDIKEINDRIHHIKNSVPKSHRTNP